MDLSSDERDVVQYLKSWKEQFVSGKEICRRAAGKKRFQKEPHWFFRIMPLMMEKGVIETDGNGHYRVKGEETKKQDRTKQKKWVSPQIARILKQSGKTFELNDGDE